MKVVPIFQRAAFRFIEEHHRHHRKPVGSIFQIAAEIEGNTVGVAIVGRPVARVLDYKTTCEVIRLCTDGTPNVCSKLYSACARIAREMGYKRIITYILESEVGTSLRASNWKYVKDTEGGSWDTPTRRRTDNHPIVKKKLFEKAL